MRMESDNEEVGPIAKQEAYKCINSSPSRR